MECACLSVQSKLSKEEISRAKYVTAQISHGNKRYKRSKTTNLWAANRALPASVLAAHRLPTRQPNCTLTVYFGLIKNNLQMLFGRGQNFFHKQAKYLSLTFPCRRSLTQKPSTARSKLEK